MLQEDCLKQDRGNRAETITKVEEHMGSMTKHRTSLCVYGLEGLTRYALAKSADYMKERGQVA